jgi:mono/diheme cytochrome c family protein
VKAWDIDVRPDFKGLPKGKGNVERGNELFEEKCASCHGSFGESNEVFTPLAGGTTKDDIKTGNVKGLSSGELPQRTTFTKVATISTLWDYIHRAMPWTAPKSLKPDEVYAILAYLLNLQEIVPADFVLSDKNIAEVQKLLPNRNGMTTDHGLWPGASAKKGGIGNGGKPDTCQQRGVHEELQAGSADRLDPAGLRPHGARRTGRPEPQLRRRARHPHARPGSRQEGSRCRHAGTGDEERLHGLPWHEEQDRRPGLQRDRRPLPGPDRCRIPPGRQGQGRRAGRLGLDPDAAERSRQGRGHHHAGQVDPVTVPSNPNFYRGEVMNNQRRTVLKSGSGAALLGMLAAAGIITPGMALADWNKAAFDAKSMADTLKALGAGQPADSKDVVRSPVRTSPKTAPSCRSAWPPACPT